VKLDAAEREVRELKAEGQPLGALGKDRLTELDAWAHSMAQQFAPKKDEKTGRMVWECDGDEARFVRYMKLCGEYAAARAPYESPRLAAVAVARQGEKMPDIYKQDPYKVMEDIVDRLLAAEEAAESTVGLGPPPAAARAFEQDGDIGPQLRAQRAFCDTLEILVVGRRGNLIHGQVGPAALRHSD
jgi:hypothetical protein